MKNVQIYTTPTCVYCRMSKEFFKKNNVEFTEHNVATDAEKREEMIQKTGQLGVPVIDVDGELTVGYDEGRLKSLLGIA